VLPFRPTFRKLFNLTSLHLPLAAGISSAVLCIAHRGRLSLLTELLGYPLPALLHKIRGRSEIPLTDPSTGDKLDTATGDVLSHLVHEPVLEYEAKGGKKNKVKVSMLQNPSHLEAVNPVAMGKARARQTFGKIARGEADTSEETRLGDDVICIQVHGDAAITGQGIVMETMGLSELPHYNCGGSVHLVINK
jgi:probable 2-oxoglutarate dehydrogenase E1 component DHKTD1